MDVKSTGMLPQRVRGEAPSPQSWGTESYVLVPKSSLQRQTTSGAQEGSFRPCGTLRPEGLAHLQGMASVSSVCSASTSDASVLSKGVCTGDVSCGTETGIRNSDGFGTATGPGLYSTGVTNIRDLVGSSDPRSQLLLELIQRSGSIDKTLLGRVMNGAALTEKHYYDYTSYSDLAATPNTVGAFGGFTSPWINAPTIGTGYSNRIGQEIEMLRLHIRGHFAIQHKYTQPLAESWTTNSRPRVWLAVTREPTVIVAATPRAFLTADSFSPGTTLNPYSNLGRSVAPAAGCLWLEAVPNPLSKGLVEILDQRHFPSNRNDNGLAVDSVHSAIANPTLTQQYPHTYYLDMDIDLHGWKSLYLTGLNTPATNGLSLQAIFFDPSNPAGTTASAYFQCWYDVSFDLVFRDSATS